MLETPSPYQPSPGWGPAVVDFDNNTVLGYATSQLGPTPDLAMARSPRSGLACIMEPGGAQRSSPSPQAWLRYPGPASRFDRARRVRRPLSAGSAPEAHKMVINALRDGHETTASRDFWRQNAVARGRRAGLRTPAR
jgi:hypothetical protein